MRRTAHTALSRGASPYVTDLDQPLLALSPTDRFTLRDAFNGVHVFGSIGSGKTSGSGKALATAYLRAGFGLLVCISKYEEIELWINYARRNGRAHDLVLFTPEKGAYNFLARSSLAGA